MSKSEVARLRQQIESEYEAAQRGLQSYAVVSRHDFITARMERINEYREQLVALVGDHEAIKIVCGLAETCGE